MPWPLDVCGYPQISNIAYRCSRYEIIRSSSKERILTCKTIEKDRRELRGRGDRLGNANGKLVLEMRKASNSKSRVE